MEINMKYFYSELLKKKAGDGGARGSCSKEEFL